VQPLLSTVIASILHTGSIRTTVALTSHSTFVLLLLPELPLLLHLTILPLLALLLLALLLLALLLLALLLLALLLRVLSLSVINTSTRAITNYRSV
jgi:hypothetical protein